jgi:pimeloyl-ACP methyl ester carboxylesterase
VVFTDEELIGIGVPVQALFGGRSPLRAAADRLRVVVPHWRVDVLPDAGHALVMDAEDDVIDRVLAFPPVASTVEVTPEGSTRPARQA